MTGFPKTLGEGKKGFTGKYVSPQVYDELEDMTGYDRKTIQNYKHVADNIDSFLRKEDLSLNHHRAVAAISIIKALIAPFK